MKDPVRVTVTGAAGQIGYALVFRIASGQMLGDDQPVILQLLEIPQAVGALEGVRMELDDCAFPLLSGVVCTDDPVRAFDGSDYALLVGAMPRKEGMERADLLSANGAIFTTQGKAISDGAADGVKVLVVGNPANTNALIAMNNAPNTPDRQFTAMTRLDHNPSVAQLAAKPGAPATLVPRLTDWGDPSPTPRAGRKRVPAIVKAGEPGAGVGEPDAVAVSPTVRSGPIIANLDDETMRPIRARQNRDAPPSSAGRTRSGGRGVRPTAAGCPAAPPARPRARAGWQRAGSPPAGGSHADEGAWPRVRRSCGANVGGT